MARAGPQPPNPRNMADCAAMLLAWESVMVIPCFPSADTICVVNVADHTFYRDAPTVQLDFIKQTATDKLVDIPGVQSFDLIRGFREI